MNRGDSESQHFNHVSFLLVPLGAHVSAFHHESFIDIYFDTVHIKEVSDDTDRLPFIINTAVKSAWGHELLERLKCRRMFQGHYI